MTVRAYVPLTSGQLAALVEERRLAAPLPAHAVTDALQAEWTDGDEDDWEYAAMAAAAAASWQARGDADLPRRHVLAVDVAGVRPVGGDDVTAVELTHDVVWRNVASAHVDTSDRATDPGDDDLAWFASQEIPGLVRTLG